MLPYTRSFVFIRHGEAEDYHKDKERKLSKSGILQAKKRAITLQEYQFDLIITSSALRAQQTSNVILEKLNITPIVVELDELYQPILIHDRDNINFLLEKLGASTLDKYLKKDKYFSWERYTQDAFAALQNAVNKLQVNRILVVAHGNVINSVGLCINPKAKLLREIYFNYCEGFILSNQELRILKDTDK